MKILNFSYKDHKENHPGWEISQTDLQSINLFVGKSGAGKTKILNKFFGLGLNIVNPYCLDLGYWSVSYIANSKRYIYELECHQKDKALPLDQNNILVTYERLTQLSENEERKDLIERQNDTLKFKGQTLPTLPNNQTGLYLLQGEPAINEAFDGFKRFKRRQFDGTALIENRSIKTLQKSILQSFANNKTIEKFISIEPNLSQTLYLLHKFFPEKFKIITDTFKSIFKEVKEFRISEAQYGQDEIIPIIQLKESSEQWVVISELSSGMLKVLLILTDLQSLPLDSIYIVDEYENSLGINAIDFLPDYLIEYGTRKQILITSHHPYIINSIPIKNWILVTRNGLIINTKTGSVLEERYGKSKQQAFMKLINDPLYLGDI